MKREGKNPFIPLHRDRSPSRSTRPINAPRSDKSLSQTHGDNHFYRDLVPWWPLQTLDFGPDSELADGQSSSPIRSARAIENVM